MLDLGTYDVVFLYCFCEGDKNRPVLYSFHRPSGPPGLGHPFALVAYIALGAEYDRIIRADQIAGYLCIMDLTFGNFHACA